MFFNLWTISVTETIPDLFTPFRANWCKYAFFIIFFALAVNILCLLNVAKKNWIFLGQKLKILNWPWYKFSKFSNLPGYPLQDLPYNRVSLLLSEIENNNYKSWKHFQRRNYFSRRKHEMTRKVKKYFFFKPL